MKIKVFPLLLSIIILFIPVGCTNQEDTIQVKKEITLKIVDITFIPEGTTAIDEKLERLNSRYIDIYRTENPNVNFEIEQINIKQNNQLKETLNQIKPDLVMMDPEQLVTLIEENAVIELDPFIKKDDFDVDGIVPYVREGIRKMGNGKWYGFAPIFHSQVLVYNKGMFDTAGVQYPRDGMTWTEVFQLAQRVSDSKSQPKRYGISLGLSSIFDNMLKSFAPSKNLFILDNNLTQMEVATEEWAKSWELMISLQRQQVLPGYESLYSDQQVVGPYHNDDFLSGRAAMEIIDNRLLHQIILANENPKAGYTPIEWDIVTLPVHDQNNKQTNGMELDGLMSIYSESKLQEEAWQFIKFINSDRWASIKSGNTMFMVSREKWIKPAKKMNYNVKAFYPLVPVSSGCHFERLQYKDHRYLELINLGRTKFDEVYANQKDIKQALEEWQTEGGIILKSIAEKQEEKNPLLSY